MLEVLYQLDTLGQSASLCTLFSLPKVRVVRDTGCGTQCGTRYVVLQIRPLSLLPLSAVFALPNAMTFSCLVLGQPWPTLRPLLLWVRHSGIASLLIFCRLVSLFPLSRLSLALISLTFFLELKCTESASVRLTP